MAWEYDFVVMMAWVMRFLILTLMPVCCVLLVVVFIPKILRRFGEAKALRKKAQQLRAKYGNL